MRPIIMGALALLTALGVLYYSQIQQTRKITEIHLASAQLCRDVADMVPGGPLPALAREMQASLTTVEQLHNVITQHDAALDSLRIMVETNDAAPPYGDGSATHQAHVVLNDQTRFVLRFLHAGDVAQLRVIGYWLPE
jgi:hypothetical protein